MKKITALLLAMILLLACTPAMAAEQRYLSEVLGSSVVLPDYLSVIGEIPDKNGEGDNIFFYAHLNAEDALITGQMYYMPEYLGMQTKDVPKEDIEQWKSLFSADYPRRSKSVMLRPKYSSSQRIYRYYGQNERGQWILGYTGVRDGLFVRVFCETGQFGFRRNLMQAVFEAFNDCFQLYAASKGVEFVRYDPEDYEVEIFNLLYDDSPTSIFQNY